MAVSAIGTERPSKELCCCWNKGASTRIFPTALEEALTLKEISYIHAEGYPAAEMKLGPIALVDEQIGPLILASSNDTRALTAAAECSLFADKLSDIPCRNVPVELRITGLLLSDSTAGRRTAALPAHRGATPPQFRGHSKSTQSPSASLRGYLRELAHAGLVPTLSDHGVAAPLAVTARTIVTT